MSNSPNFPQSCPLCGSDNTELISNTGKQVYFSCDNCELTSLSQNQLLEPAEEQFRYEQHNNNPNDPRYRDFLGKLFNPLQPLLEQGSFGLDFGCGPGPALALMFKEAGYRMNTYDPYFANNPSVLDERYDFITSTEVFEHLYNPYKEIDLLFSLLKPRGIVGVMTKLLKDEIDFPTWFYRNDTTHVSFYTKKTWEWVSNHWNAKILTLDDNIVIIQKF
jgi:hypothetical protein